MDSVPFFIMGTMFGIVSTLLIQAYGRRRVRKALDARDDEPAKLADRVAVLEALATDERRELNLHRNLESIR